MLVLRFDKQRRNVYGARYTVVSRMFPGWRLFRRTLSATALDGIDYLGPVEVTLGRKREKRWVAVFTCLAERAVHFEVVRSLSSQSCLMVIRRFCSKRGVPQEIFSDNGTCFVGAEKELKKINAECATSVTNATTAWRFNPPAAPHMGGIWERMVRSVKEAMKALDDGRTLTDEVRQTTSHFTFHKSTVAQYKLRPFFARTLALC